VYQILSESNQTSFVEDMTKTFRLTFFLDTVYAIL